MTKMVRWVSNEFATFTVTTEDGIITDSSPIAKRFKGKPFMNLVHWLVKKGDPVIVKILEQTNE